MILLDPEETPVEKSHLQFPVVGIGASAGGVAALQGLFSQMPANTGMAFVVVVHLSPDHLSSMDEILQRSTTMPVLAVTGAVAIQANHVYVISPSKRLAMSDGYLRVSEMSVGSPRSGTVDKFFRTLAQAHQERAVCVVLSGTGADGTQGLKRIKELGGVTFAQSPHEAEYDGMPRSAIDTELVDVVLPVGEMPQKMVQLWANSQRLELPRPPADLKVEAASEGELHLAEEALVSIKALLRERTGHNFTHYKRSTVLRRLERRMQVNAVPDLPTYRRFLETHPLETPALLQDMLISVTNFFRDPQAFEALQQRLGTLIQGRPPGRTFRAWVAGCATGEEAYSIAILLHELLDPLDTPVQVFASDIDQRAVTVARRGVYPQSITTDVTPARLGQYFFSDEQQSFRVIKPVRDNVIFSTHNVLSDPPFMRMDLICCRNLLIYLDRQAQAQLLNSFYFGLNPEALLFLGSSETADIVDGLFVGEDKTHRLFRKVRSVATPRPLPPMPALMPRSMPSAEPPPAPASRRPPLELLHERALIHHGPPSVLVDADGTVLHVDGRATHLLRLPAGAPTQKLLELARPEIRVELRTALSRAVKSVRSVEARRVRLTVNGQAHFLKMSVHPVSDGNCKGLFLVVFDETEESLIGEVGEQGKDPVVVALEADLLDAQDKLRSTATESAASTEELRASNEELQTINEELRSTTEELETSREELQSVNEELSTVNTELLLKIEETGKANDDLQNLIVSAEIGTVFVDQDMRIKRFTPLAATLFNLLATDVGRPLMDITHRLDYPNLAKDVKEVFESLRRIEREVGAEDGRWLLVRILPYRTSESRIDGAILSFVDVSARRLAEEQLHLSEQRMRVVADSMRDYAIVTLDPESVITTWSPGAERIFGYAAEEAIGQAFDLIFTPEDRANGLPQLEIRQAREKGSAADDRWHLRKDGKRVFCSGITTPLIAAGFSGYAKIARDFTREKQQEIHRDAALSAEMEVRFQLEQSSSLKDQFLAVMSHELKNPLNVIHMNAQLLQRLSRDEAVVKRAAGTIANAVVSQGKIIDDLLDLSRVNTGKLALQKSPVNLHEVVERIAQALQPDLAARHHTLQIDTPPKIEIFADPVRVEQIVWNLATNAVKFTPDHGSVKIGVQEDAGMARLDVSDSGIGLEHDDLDRVFELFQQVDRRVGRLNGGLGIGLALVKELVDLHGGRVKATSQGPGKGSTFSVWLPVEASTQPDSESVETASVMSGLRILLVDDEPEVLTVLAELLTLEGAHVSAVSNAQEALQRLRQQDFDVLASDIAMPGHDGYWLIRELRASPKGRQLVTIAVSGRSRESDRRRALEEGFDAHLGKPVELEELKSTIGRIRL